MNDHLVWTPAEMPQLDGRVVVVTGANSGIGFAAALEFARAGAQVVLACRNMSRGEEAERRIKEQVKDARVCFLQLDIGKKESIQQFATAFQTRFDALHILVNNAGVASTAEPCTADGFESRFGTNHLGHFYLTSLLMDTIVRSAPARVVNVSSMAHRVYAMDWNELQRRPTAPPAWFVPGYCRSKLANLLFTYELQRRIDAAGIEGVKSVGCHPGVTLTNIFPSVMQLWLPEWFQGVGMTLLAKLPFFQTPEMGALPTLYAAVHDDVKSATFYGPRGFLTCAGYPCLEKSSVASHSEEDGRMLWSLSESLLQHKFEISC